MLCLGLKHMASQYTYVAIGDHITLLHTESGFLGADGFSSIQVGVRDALHTKMVERESVFIVKQQHNYSVERQMRSFL